MRHKRTRIQYYSAEPSRGRLRDKPWLPFALLAAAALVLALIIGAILGAVADDSEKNSAVYGDLFEIGEVDAPAKQYTSLFAVNASFISHGGMSENALEDAIDDLPDGNAVGLWLYDGTEDVLFAATLADKTEGLRPRSPLSARKIVEIAADLDRYLIGYFTAGSFQEKDEQLRLLAVAREMALLRELADAGVREVVLMGLPHDAAQATRVASYVRQADEILGETVLTVAAPKDASATARLVGVCEAYADAFALDVRSLSGKALVNAITENAYYVSFYRMRVLLSDADPNAAMETVNGDRKSVV